MFNKVNESQLLGSNTNRINILEKVTKLKNK